MSKTKYKVYFLQFKIVVKLEVTAQQNMFGPQQQSGFLIWPHRKITAQPLKYRSFTELMIEHKSLFSATQSPN